MNIHELNTKAITNPAYVALDDGSDTYKLDLNAKLSTMQSSISGAESNIATAQGDITLLQTNMGQAQGAISSAQGEIEDLQSDLNALSTQTSASIGNLQTELDATEDDVTDLKEAIEQTNDNLEALEQQGYPMASITEAVDAWADEHQHEIVNNYVTPEMYGAKGDGVTDDTQALIDAATHGTVMLADGSTYLIDNATITNCTIIGNGAVIKTKATFALTIASSNRNVIVENLKIDCNGYGGLNLTGNGIEVKTCFAYNVGTYGFYIGTTSNFEINFISCKAVSSSATGHTGTGFYINTSDCSVINCTAINFSIGFWSFGANIFIGCHTWIAQDHLKADSIGFELKEDEICIGCYADSVQYAFYLNPNTYLLWKMDICESRWYINDSKSEGITFYFVYSSAGMSAKNIRITGINYSLGNLPFVFFPDTMAPRFSGVGGTQAKHTFAHTTGTNVTENSYSVTYFDGGMAYKGTIVLSDALSYGGTLIGLPVSPFHVTNGFGRAIKSDGTYCNIDINLSSIVAGIGGMTAGTYDLRFTMYY